MARTYPRDRLNRLLNWRSAHTLFPVDPVEIFDLHSHRRTEGFTMTNTREKTHGIFLDLHTPATAIATLSALEVSVNDRLFYWQTSRQPLYNHGQAGAMRLACCEKTKHRKTPASLCLIHERKITHLLCSLAPLATMAQERSADAFLAY